jgi:hypothetical protein
MFVYFGGRLSAAIALRSVEIKGGNAMLAEGAFERDAAIRRFGRVISQGSHYSPYRLVGALGNGCATFGWETLFRRTAIVVWLLLFAALIVARPHSQSGHASLRAR